MSDVIKLVQNEARTIRLQVMGTNSTPAILNGYEEARLDLVLYNIYDGTSQDIKSWSVTAGTAAFIDRNKGIVEFYITSTDTRNLASNTYNYRIWLEKGENSYLVRTGSIWLKE